MNRLVVLLAACGSSPAHPDATQPDTTPADAAHCTTRVTYGDAWISSHPDPFDDVDGEVTWDGACHDDGANSYATLSNGFTPYFTGHGACAIALDDSCATSACTTRISYGDGWLPPANHANSFDDVTGRVFGDGSCENSATTLSNGWQPHFSGATCPLAFRYDQCGGLYANPVIAKDAPDPGVLLVAGTYYLAHTGDDFPLFTSTDLTTWTPHGKLLSAHPAWAKSDFWAPEIHSVGGHYVAYFSARGADGMLAIGAASADAPAGPYTALAAPLIHDASMGLIDASEITTADGNFVLWKEDGNAIAKPTPIHAQRLAADGLSVTGPVATLITNDLGWESKVTEGPFMVAHAGMYYLFYSGNSYANATYAVGVARASSPMGPFTKRGDPILVTNTTWVGPGHCSVVDAPGGETAIVYHAWKAGCVNTAGCGRETLVDLIHWDADGWPSIPLAPSATTRPRP